MKWFITGFFYLVFGDLLFSQNNHVLLDRLKKEQEITLLNNKYNIVPLQHLDTLDIGVVVYGNNSLKAFTERVKSYSDATFYFTDSDNFNGIERKLQKHDLLIVAYGYASGYSKAINFFSNFTKKGYVIQVSFVGADLIAKKQNIDQADALILPLDSSKMSQDFTAQLIYGGIGAQGILKEGIGNVYEKGSGKKTLPTRIKYTIPEELGINAETLDERISQIIEKGLKEKAFPGAQILAIKNGKLFFHKTFGYHRYDSLEEDRREVKKDDIYDLASVTKVTGATLALMKLHDNGDFNLDIPAYTYWPDLKKGKKKEMTFREILAHNAQLKSWIPYWTTTTKKNGRYKNKTISKISSEDFQFELGDNLYLHKNYKEQIYKMIKKSPLNEKAGYVYSGLSFYLYPQIVRNISGKSFEDFLMDEFYVPITAKTLTFNPLEKFPLERIIPTEIDTFFRKKELHGVVHDEGAAMMQGISGNAGLFAKGEDLAKVWQMLLNGGKYGGRQYLSSQVIDKFTSCQYCEQGNRRGLGFDKPLITYHPTKSSVAKGASSRSFGHSGYTGTFVWADPENDFLYIFLSNRVYPTRKNRKIYELNIRPDIHNVFYELFEN